MSELNNPVFIGLVEPIIALLLALVGHKYRATGRIFGL